MPSPLEISIVVPVYSGRAYLERLVEEVAAVRRSWAEADVPLRLTELILVDDEAVDGSGDTIDALAERAPWVVALHLSRNYGQHAATMAGILHASGDWVITMDEDLQHPPSRIEDLLVHAARSGSDVVYACPASKDVHGKVWRDGSSRTFKRLMEWATGTPTLRLVNSFRAIRGPIARATAGVSTHNTYFDIALTGFTQRVSSLDIEMSDSRFMQTGRSGYDIRKLVAHAQRMLFSSPLRFLSFGLWVGGGLFVLSFLAAAYYTLRRLLLPSAVSVEGWTSIVVLICSTTGLLAIMLGLCLQYLSTLVLKAHGRPVFFTIDRSGDAALARWAEDRKGWTERDDAA